jgi:hypothetical protein
MNEPIDLIVEDETMRGLQFIEQAPKDSEDFEMMTVDVPVFAFMSIVLSVIFLCAPCYLLYIRVYPPEMPVDENAKGPSETDEERYEAIEARLVSKPVLAHDLVCDKVTAAAVTPEEEEDNDDDCDEPVESSQSSDNETECLICFEPFAAGDIVSWSSACEHVSHHACIKAWLLRHDSCPSCRETILPMNTPADPSADPPADADQEDKPIPIQSDMSTKSYYCQRHGLVHVKVDNATPRELRERAAFTCCATDLAQQGRHVPTYSGTASSTDESSVSGPPPVDDVETGIAVVSSPTASMEAVDGSEEPQLVLEVPEAE